MGSKRRRALAAAVALSLAAGGLASAAPPTIVEAGNLVLKIYGDVTPKTLPRRERAPIGFYGGGRLSTDDGSQPPALDQVRFDVDRDVAVDVGRLPICRRGQIEARDTDTVKQLCRGAILGAGEATVEVGFPEQAPIISTGPVILLNGGESAGVTTLFLHAYVDIPAPTAVIAPVKIRRQSKGVFGLRVDIDVPRIANGFGSVIRSSLRSIRLVGSGEDKRGFVFARCPDQRLLARGVFEFLDRSRMAGTVVRACKGVE